MRSSTDIRRHLRDVISSSGQLSRPTTTSPLRRVTATARPLRVYAAVGTPAADGHLL